MPLHALPDITHHNIDKSILDETEKNEDGAGRHEYVNSLCGQQINKNGDPINMIAQDYFNYLNI